MAPPRVCPLPTFPVWSGSAADDCHDKLNLVDDGPELDIVADLYDRGED